MAATKGNAKSNGHKKNGTARTAKRGTKPARIVTKNDLRETKFAKAYVENNGDAAKAARAIGLTGEALRVTGSRMLRRSNVQIRLSRWVEEGAGVTPREIIGRLAEQARADMTDLVDDDGRVDLLKIKESGLGHLVRRIKVRQEVGDKLRPAEIMDIEFESKQKADELLGRFLHLEQQPVTNVSVNILAETSKRIAFCRAQIAMRYDELKAAGTPWRYEDIWMDLEESWVKKRGESIADLRNEVLRMLGVEENPGALQLGSGQ